MANFNLNKVILGGRLTADPELKQTPTGVALVSFSVAVNRRFGNRNGEDSQTDFINITAWRQTAEFVSKYFRKGSSICIVGSIQTRSWTDQQGAKRYATEVVADEAYFVDSKGEVGSVGNGVSYGSDMGAAQFSGNQPGNAAPKFEDVASDDDLPF